MLEAYVRQKREEKPILLMTHIVLGYPSFENSEAIVDAMVASGVDLIELQIPFSEPMADGPVILHANQKALAAGSTVKRCFEMAARLSAKHPHVPFLFMSYYNIAFKRGVMEFCADARAAGIRGVIIPDVPHEEAGELFEGLRKQELDPILLFSPRTGDARMREIASYASGFIYCIARKGVTGAATDFGALRAYIERCRSATKLPLALGFGVKDRADVKALTGQVDIAVVGSETIKVIDEHGVGAVGRFVAELR